MSHQTAFIQETIPNSSVNPFKMLKNKSNINMNGKVYAMFSQYFRKSLTLFFSSFHQPTLYSVMVQGSQIQLASSISPACTTVIDCFVFCLFFLNFSNQVGHNQDLSNFARPHD